MTPEILTIFSARYKPNLLMIRLYMMTILRGSQPRELLSAQHLKCLSNVPSNPYPRALTNFILVGPKTV